MKIVIVGGGFAGLKLARKINNKDGFEVLLIDKVNYHQFQPLFYQVATAALDASNISFPLRKAFHKSKNVRIRLGELKQVIPGENKIIINDNEEISYDRLVLALGAETNFFGNKLLAEKSFPMKSTVEALQLRHRLIRNFEEALTVKDPEELQRLMNIVVVGGGPTGVEVAGALAEMKKYVLPKDYPELDFSKMNIYLLEGMPKTLGAMSEKSSAQSQKYLVRLGVNVLTSTRVENYDGRDVKLVGGKIIQSNTVIWAAGVMGVVPAGIEKDLIVKGNRLIVDRQFKLKNSPDIYILGDLAYMETQKYPHGHPQLAGVAVQQGSWLGKHFRKMRNENAKPLEFEYHDKGTMATVGRNLAVVDVPKPKLHFGGFLGWMIWMSLHLYLLLGVKNKFFVFSNWIYNYITHDQSLRLIFPEFNRKK